MNWDAVGKVTLANDSFCTGILVAESVVLTAAHCLFDAEGNRNDQAIFQAGFHFGGVKAASPVIKTIIPDAFGAARLGYGVADGFDYAFLVLKWPVGQDVGFLDLTGSNEFDIQIGDSVIDVGYGNAGNRLTAGINCKITLVNADHTFQHDCATIDGDSGGPIFLVKGETFHLIGITSYGYPYVGEYIGVAVSREVFLDELVRVTGEQSSVTQAGSGPGG